MNFDGDLSPNPTRNVDNPEWIQAKTRGRWAPYWNAQTRTYNPPRSEKRTEARKKKYAWSRLTMRGGPEYVPLHLCMTGDELLAERGRIRGDGTSFRLGVHTDEARELVALLPHARLRWCEARLMLAVAYAMVERKRHGLVATVRELGAFVGLERTATAEALGRLVAIGWLHADATYTEYGECESQRANLWRLTTQAIAAFALVDVPPAVVVPTGTVDRARLQRRRRPVGSRTHATPRNPDPNPDVVCTTDEDSGRPSGMGAAPSKKIDGPTTTTGAVSPASSAESCSPALRAPEGEVRRGRGRPLSTERLEARAELAAWQRELDLRPELEAREARERVHAQDAANRAELAARAQKRAAEASDEFTPEAFAALVSDPAAKQAILDAARARRTLDDTELRFSLLDLHDEPTGGDS